MPRTGFYSGSFDPVTLGHIDVMARACRLVDRLVVGIGVHPAKSPLFSGPERVTLLEAETQSLAAHGTCAIDVVTFEGLVIAAARHHGATVIFRGLRDGGDFDYEMRMAGMNGAMAPEVQTVFIPAAPSLRSITATLVRQVALMGGDVTPFVSPEVARRLVEKCRTRPSSV